MRAENQWTRHRKVIYTIDRVLTDRFRVWWRRRHGNYTIGRWKYPWR